MNKKLLFILLILALACLGTPEVKRDVTGVEITEFRPDLDEVRAGNNAILRLKAQNVGDYDAAKVEAEIYKCGNLKIDGAKCPRKYSLGDLSGVDTSSNLPGGEAEKTFTLSTSDVNNAENEQLAQEIGLRVSYGYESSATAEIPVLSNARYKELERDGKLPSAKTDASFAPVQVSITAPPQAVGTAYINLDIGLENLMDGYVEGTGCANKVGCIDSIKIALSGKGVAKQDCSDRGGIELWRTGKRTFTCTLKPDCSEGECYPVVKVTAKYTYVTETATTLTITGTPGSGAGGPLPPPPPEVQKSSFDVIRLNPANGTVPQEITVTGINFSKSEKNIHVYLEGDKYSILNGRRQKTQGRTTVKLTPVPGQGTPSRDNLGIDPVESGGYGIFTAKFKIPNDIADSAIAKAFAIGDTYGDKDFAATPGYSNAQNLEIVPKAKITASPPEARSGEGVTVTVKGEKYSAKEATIYFLNPQCANYGGDPPIKSGCAKEMAKRTPDATGAFSYSFLLDQAFMDSKGIYPNYYLVYASSQDIEDAAALNGAGEFTISFGGADSDHDGVPDNLDTVCPPTPPGVPVCSVEEAKLPGDCKDRQGCEKLTVSLTDFSAQDRIVALTIKSTETTGSYAVTYDDNKPYKFTVKKNGVEATLAKQELTAVPADDTLFVFKIKNTGTFDITNQMDVYVRGIGTNDIQTQPAHCMGITLNANKEAVCALLVEDITANAYQTKLKVTRTGTEYLLGGFDFTVGGSVKDTNPPSRTNGKPTGTAYGSNQALFLATGETATCRYSTTANTDYDSMTSATTASGTTHSWQLTGLSEGAHSYYVRCKDSAGNKNADDYTISFTVAQPIIRYDYNSEQVRAFAINDAGSPDYMAYIPTYDAAMQTSQEGNPTMPQTRGFKVLNGSQGPELTVNPILTIDKEPPKIIPKIPKNYNVLLVFDIQNMGTSEVEIASTELDGLGSGLPKPTISCTRTTTPIKIAGGGKMSCAFLSHNGFANNPQYDVTLAIRLEGAAASYTTEGFTIRTT